MAVFCWLNCMGGANNWDIYLIERPWHDGLEIAVFLFAPLFIE